MRFLQTADRHMHTETVVNFTCNKLKQPCLSSKDPSNVHHKHAINFIVLKGFWLKVRTFDLCCLANWFILKSKLCAAGIRSLSVAKAFENCSNQSNETRMEGGGHQTEIILRSEPEETEGQKAVDESNRHYVKRERRWQTAWLSVSNTGAITFCNTQHPLCLYHGPTLIHLCHLSMTLSF